MFPIKKISLKNLVHRFENSTNTRMTKSESSHYKKTAKKRRGGFWRQDCELLQYLICCKRRRDNKILSQLLVLLFSLKWETMCHNKCI